MNTSVNIQKILDVAKAKEIAAYVTARNRKHPERLTTLRIVCRRFRINQADAIRAIESVDFLALSKLAYKPPPKGAGFGEVFAAAFVPVIWDDALTGCRLVIVLDQPEG